MPEPIEVPQERVAGWEPKIVAFFCNWCTYMAADLAGTSRMKYAPNARVIRVMCSGRIDPQFVMEAFANGADGVLVGGCHFGDCHYQSGNHKALRRFRLLQRVMAGMGIEDDRLRLEWISAAEADKLRDVMNDMAARLTALGPLHLEVPDEGPEAESRAEEATPAAAQELAEVTA
jgi:F420-non-reducing hydrogenase iron-sulfur subunit